MARYQELILFILLALTAAPIVIVFLPVILVMLLVAGMVFVYRKLARS